MATCQYFSPRRRSASEDLTVPFVLWVERYKHAATFRSAHLASTSCWGGAVTLCRCDFGATGGHSDTNGDDFRLRGGNFDFFLDLRDRLADTRSESGKIGASVSNATGASTLSAERDARDSARAQRGAAFATSQP